TTTSAALEAVDGLSPTLAVQNSDEAFIGSHFQMSATGVATAEYEVAFTGQAYTNQESKRYISSTDDIGNGGSVGLKESLTAGTITANLNHGISANTLTTTDPNLIGFSLTAVPEPGTYALFGLGLLGLIGGYIRKKREA
ncbi:PEP-CTERM sorting domain-containing protein, partial [Candidatus Auribacterota bacterium]